jgi:hypothetical protein
VGTFHGKLPQLANTRSQVTIVKQDFNNNALPPLPRYFYNNKTAHIVTKSILVSYNVINITIPFTMDTPVLDFHVAFQIPYVYDYIIKISPVRDFHVAFQIPYVYDYIIKICRQQAEVIQNHDNENVRFIGQGEAQHRKYKRLKLGGGHVYDRSSV